MKFFTVCKAVLSISLLSNLFAFLPAQAAILFVGEEVNNDVVFTYSGSIDTTGLGAPGALPLAPTGVIVPSDGSLGLATGSQNSQSYTSINISGPSNFGLGGVTTGGIATEGSYEFAFGLSGFEGSSAIFTRSNYISGSPLNGSFTFENATFASLGIDDSQSYTWTLDDNGDTITLQFNNASVPEPTTIIGTLTALGFAQVFKKKKKKLKLNS